MFWTVKYIIKLRKKCRTFQSHTIHALRSSENWRHKYFELKSQYKLLDKDLKALRKEYSKLLEQQKEDLK